MLFYIAQHCRHIKASTDNRLGPLWLLSLTRKRMYAYNAALLKDALVDCMLSISLFLQR
ncbi:hypothetical protein BJ165DRAFT_1483714 [Panaeolus papilionaceus]|nr:hypothetical protein BJ165DRAFT_1483714 [Panaeolus papilionaceus]